MKRSLIWTGLAALALAAASLSTNEAKARVNAGTLTCQVDGGFALIFSKPRKLHCVFHNRNGENEAYKGKLREFGLDVGVSGHGAISWRVSAPTRSPGPGALGGRYSGIEAGAAVAAGLRGVALVGGTNRSIILQPLTMQGEMGVNIAVGVSSITLHPLFSGQAHPLIPASGHARAEHPVPAYGCGAYTHLESGQTIAGLARACNVTVEAILDVNPQITNVRNISAGALVHLPNHTGREPDVACGEHAILGQGETLEQLAWRCGVTRHALLVANPMIREAHHVRAGLVLTIPERSTGQQNPPVIYAATEDHITDEYRSQIGGTYTYRSPHAPSDTDHLTHGDRLRLEAACVDEAEDRYGFRDGDVHATESHHSTHNTVSVSLSADHEDATCLIDHDGNVLYVSEMTNTRHASASGYHAEVDSGASAGSAAPVAFGPRTEEVRFRAGASSATVSGTLTGYDTVNYAVHGFVGQTMSVRFNPDNNSCFVNVLPPSGGEAIFNGSILGNAFSDRLPADGDYTVQAYMMRNAARENQTCHYSIAFDVSGQSTAALTSAADDSSSETRTAENACLAAVAAEVGVNRNQVSVVEVLGGEAGIGVTVQVPNATAPWSCLSDAAGNVQGVSFTGSDSGGVPGGAVGSGADSADDSGAGTKVAEEACLAAVASEVGVNPAQVSTIDVLGGEAGIGVTVQVPGAEKPWSCLSDADGNVQGVTYLGEG